MAKKKMTGSEIMEQDMKDFEADIKAMMEEAAPKTPLEASIDRATGFKPEDTLNVPCETEQADSETEQAETETEKADSGTEKADSGTGKADSGTKKRDYVEEAYTCFIKDAGDIDPMDPVKAIEAYFQKNATDELKARCKVEGKDANGCWKFIEAVARKALRGSSGHIDPAVVYAIAMHWFEDVPEDWDKAAKRSSTVKAMPKPTTRKERLEERVAHGSSKAKAKLRELKKKERAKAKTKKPRAQQGFFFEMLEMHTGQPEKDGLSSPQASAGASGEENAMVPSTLPASTSSESEVQE